MGRYGDGDTGALFTRKPLVERAIILSHSNYKMSVPATEEAEAKHAMALPVAQTPQYHNLERVNLLQTWELRK